MDRDPSELPLSVLLDPNCTWATDAALVEQVAHNEWCLSKLAKDEKLYDLAGELKRSAKIAGLIASEIRQRYGGYYGDGWAI